LLITSSQSFKLQVVFFLAATEAHPGRVRVADGEHQKTRTLPGCASEAASSHSSDKIKLTV
jgi:hypothetical protein